MRVDVIPTGALTLDIALGVGGVPRGRIVEIYGPEASGKTTICQHIVASAQRRGGMAAFIDMEHALDPAYAAKCGVDIDNLLISQPDTGEQAFDIAEQLIRSSAIEVLVIDSVAALVPKAEIEGEITDMQPGIQARLMSKALRRLSGAIKQTNTCCYVYQSVAPEDRRDVWQSGDHDRRHGAQVSTPRCVWMCGAFARLRTVAM